MKQNKSYFFQSWLIVVIAIVSFIGFKSFLPKKLFPDASTNSKNIVVDSLMLEAVAEAGNLSEEDTLTNKTISFVSNPLGIKFSSEKFEQYKGYQYLIPFFEKLYQLEENQDRKVRIVHIGDSHIQADLFTGKIRYRMQQIFGNAGFGFTFPYSLANTNNSSPIKFTGSGGFSASRNLYADTSKPVGVSGISFQPKDKTFHIDMLVKDAQFDFTKLKVISPKNENIFNHFKINLKWKTLTI